MKAALEFIGETVGYWLWLAGFTLALGVIGLGMETDVGWAIMIIFTIALLIKIAYGMIGKEKSNTYDKSK